MRNSEEALALLAGKTVSGPPFFETAARALAVGIDCRWAGIVERNAEGDEAILLALVADSVVVNPFTYALDGTPCYEIYQNASAARPQCFFGKDLMARFPDDQMLRDLGAESYMGEMFFGPGGEPAGHVFVMDGGPMKDDPTMRAFFQLVCQRVGAEYNRWKAERALQESQDRLEHAAKLASIGYWVWDEIENKALYCSDELARIFGYKSGSEYTEVLTSLEADFESVHPDDLERYKSIVLEANDESRGFEAEYRIISLDGAIRCVREVAEPVYDEKGRMVRSNGVLQDVTDQRRAQEALRQTEERFQSLADHSTAVICLKDKDGRYIFINRQWERLHQVPADWFLGKTSFDVFPEETAQAFTEHDQKVMATGEAVVMEQWTPSASGPRLLMEAKFPVYDNNGKTVAVGLIGTDITEQKVAEDARHLSEQRLLDAMEAIPQGFIIYDGKGEMVTCNSNFLDLYPMTREIAVPGVRFETMVAKVAESGAVLGALNDPEAWLEERQDLHRDPRAPFQQEQSDGRWIQINEKRTREGGVITAYTDVTELKQREQALDRLLNEKDGLLSELNAVLDNIQYGIVFMDKDLHIKMHNRAYREIWGIPEEFLNDHPHFRENLKFIKSVGLAPLSGKEWENFLNTRIEEIKRGENPREDISLSDGRRLQVQCIALPDGGRMLTYFDITDIRQREASMRFAVEQAEEATLAKSRFLANMSHELRTPMNAIIGFTRLVLRKTRGEIEDRQSDNLEKILTSAEHLLMLINELLDLSKIEAGKMELHVERFDIGSLVDEIVSTARPLAQKNKNKLRLQGSLRGLAMQSDPTRIRQVVLNLMSNACKFTEKGEVCLKVQRQDDDTIRFDVQDTGIGIAEEHMENLFEEFTQADGAAMQRFGGTGLGLSISRRLCHLMGGDIHVESRLGEGSVFTVKLPRDISN